MRHRLLIVCLAGVLALSGCAAPDATSAGSGSDSAPGGPAVSSSAASGAAPTDQPVAPVDPSAIVPLPPGAVPDYQLGGAYDPAAGVTVVARDSTAQPAEGVYSICYVNGFQTQPGADWPRALVLHDASGDEVFDPGWPDERILDISTPDNREAIADRLAVTIAGCDDAGFEAVEFDNLDSYTRSGDAFGLTEAVAFAGLLVDAAHRSGLAAGQKNTPELGDRGRTLIGFDFAVAEECRRFDECASYTDVYGDQVIDIEYADDLGGTWAEVCADPQLPPASVLRDRDLAPAGEHGHVMRHC